MDDASVVVIGLDKHDLDGFSVTSSVCLTQCSVRSTMSRASCRMTAQTVSDEDQEAISQDSIDYWGRWH
jgi:hypothetical protein